MALSRDITTFEDIRPYLDQALSAEKGIRITTPSKGSAVHLRQRLYTLRALERKNSLSIYDVGDERRGKSAYDDIAISVDECAVEIRKTTPIVVQEL
jgi:hypothetical protein